MLPWTLALTSEEERLAKAFCSHRHHDQAGGQKAGKVDPGHHAPRSPQGQGEDREKEQGRHDRGQEGLGIDVQKAPDFLHVKGPEPHGIDAPDLAHCRRLLAHTSAHNYRPLAWEQIAAPG